MGSAFTPVQPRGSSAAAGSSKSARRPTKRVRQVSSLQHMKMLSEVPEVVEADEDTSFELAPDNVSTDASEASSKGSNGSQPPLLDFIGGACMASAWFTSCFPCAVVDINDSDNYVVDKLSRESAMNVMYAAKPVAPEVSSERGIHSRGSDQETNMLYVQLPGQPEPTSEPVPLSTVPSVIVEESDDEVEEKMDEISLKDDLPMRASERADSGIVDTQSGVQAPIYKPPKKSNKFSVKKMFGKKKGAVAPQ